MLLTCPYCRDIAEIPNVLQKFYGLPIACHACASIFFIPQRHAQPGVSAATLTNLAFNEQNAERVICPNCNYLSVTPQTQSSDPHPNLRCPACHDPIARLIPIRNPWVLRALLAVTIGGIIGALFSWGLLIGEWDSYFPAQAETLSSLRDGLSRVSEVVAAQMNRLGDFVTSIMVTISQIFTSLKDEMARHWLGPT